MKIKRKLTALMMLTWTGSMAQQNEQDSCTICTDKMDVVIGVILIVLAGIFVYLIRLDRKVNKLDKGS